MQHAMKIKGHQMEQDRKKFETWPLYLQNTMWTQNEECLELRKLPVSERLAGAAKLKEQGNDFFRKQVFASAIEAYEAAFGAFHYAKQLDPDWKKKGIKDETIVLVDERGDTDDEKKAVNDFLLSCYNNLAACFLGRAAAGTPELGGSIEQDYKLCVQACTHAIEIDPRNSKALYRRARALCEPMTATDEETDAAIRDLTEASAVAPDDKTVRTLLAKLKKSRLAAKKREADAFSGLFAKSELYDEKTLAAQEARAEAERRLNEPSDAARTPEDCEREAKEAEAAVEHLKEKGRLEDAAALELKVRAHRQQLDDYKKAAAAEEEKAMRRDPRNIDFANPTAEQIADAKEHGIDLMDPLVVKELMRLQKQRKFGGEDDDEDDDEEGEEGEGEEEDGATGGGRGTGTRGGSGATSARGGHARGGTDGEVPSMYRGKMHNRLQRMKQSSAREMGFEPSSGGKRHTGDAEPSDSATDATNKMRWYIMGFALVIGLYRAYSVLATPVLQMGGADDGFD